MNIIAHRQLALLAFLSFCFMVSSARAGEVFLPGETIQYEIKKVFKLGKATLTFNGPQTINKQQLVLITFRTEGLNFFDEEKIYMDPVDLFPRVVERDLNIWGKKEKIREVYDQQSGKVTVIKDADGKKSESSIQKKGKIDNIYSFLYRYRRSGSFKKNDRLKLVLPTKEVDIILKRKDTVEAADKKYEAYYMESEPKEYSLWFDTSPQRLPLRIDGAVRMGKTKMVMKEYKPGSP